MPAELSDRTQLLLEDLPPFLQQSYDIQACLDVVARELDRIETAKDLLRNNFWPSIGTDFIELYELLLSLSVDPPDKTLTQRQNTVLAFYESIKSQGTGLEWQAQITKLIGTGWSYAEHDPDDPGSPDAYIIEMTIPFTSPIPSPSDLNAVNSGSGTIAAGTYYYAVSAANFYGETPPSAVASVTVSGSEAVDLDWTASADGSTYRIYRGSSPSTLRRLDLGMTLSANSYTDDGTATPTTIPPTNTNTTGSYQSHEARALARLITPAHIQLDFGYEPGFILGSSELGDIL